MDYYSDVSKDYNGVCVCAREDEYGIPSSGQLQATVQFHILLVAFFSIMADYLFLRDAISCAEDTSLKMVAIFDFNLRTLSVM